MSLSRLYLNFLLLLDLSLLLIIVAGLLRMSNSKSFFSRLVTPVENAPERLRGLIRNGRVILAVIVLSLMLLFWVTAFNPWYAWIGFFATLAMIFLCFRRLSPVQFLLVCSVIGLSYRIAFYMTEFTVMYLLTMALLTVTYLTNRYMLSEMFRSERTKAAVSVFVLFLLVNCSMMVIWPISYRLKGLGWF
ncbi:MAG: hypothetical protein A4E61_00435 [Syntrophorhabdus sp. PtaB.Bin184]|jgi:hypothetical protein|nr:MAG: hypothetical protein A4E61_00435 [Syntrophorhabdus sp. PtaB.Bin184]